MARARTLTLASAATALLAALGACDDAATKATTLDPKCAPILDQCLERQKTCVLDAGEPTCELCPAGEFAARPSGLCEAIPGGTLSHDFGTQTLTGGQEIGSLCQTWVLDNDQEIWVNAVEMDNDGYYHHSNWFFVPENYHDWPKDAWVDCYDGGFSEVEAALVGGVLYAQSTQVKHELQKFIPGAAVHIPPRSRIITVTHLLNYTPAEKTTGLRLTMHTLPVADVTIPLSPAQLVYHDLKLPAEAQSSFGGTCDIASAWASTIGTPFAMKLHYFLPHYHALGTGFRVSIVGGARDGEVIVDLGAFSSEPFGFAFDPPIDLSDATGLAFACEYDNDTKEVVHWGIGNQEMCEGLMFLEGPMAFVGSVGETASEQPDNGLTRFTGDCNVTGFPFDPRQ